MSEAFVSLLPANLLLAEHPPVVPPEAAIPAKPDLPAKPNEIQVVDTVFAQDQEKFTALSAMGFWSAAMLIGDMAREHLQRAQEAEEEEAEDRDPNGPPKE